MTKRKRVIYATKDKLEKVNPKNKAYYKAYRNSRISANSDMKNTTYKTYQSFFNHFLVYLMEHWDNLDLYSEEFQLMAVDIMEGFMVFCQTELGNNKKVINTKLSAVSSFFHWSVRRGRVDHHPFDGKLERVQGDNDEKIIAEHFLTQKEVNKITRTLAKRENGYDIVDQLIWGIMMDSANRVGAVSKLTISSLDLENMKFNNIREKRGKLVEVVFNKGTKKIIEEWLEMRKEMDNLEVDAFFVSYYGGEYRPMAVTTLQERIKRIGLILGITDFRSHSIRKTSLNLIFEMTNNLALTAQMANHKSVETTQQSYIKPQSKTELRDEINRMRNK